MAKPTVSTPKSESLPRQPLPASRKIYVSNAAGTVRVPMREIALTDGTSAQVYDTSGPYSDLDLTFDIHKGLPDHRGPWIAARGDCEPEPHPYNRRANGSAAPNHSAALQRAPLRARPGRNVSQLHCARQGIITPEMEFIALRENQARALAGTEFDSAERVARLRGHPMGANLPREISAEFVRFQRCIGLADVFPAPVVA